MKKSMLFILFAVCLLLLSSCNCDHTYEWNILKAATCTESGEREGTCTECGAMITETVPAGHVEVIDEALEPACLTKGKTEGKHCSLCGEVFLESETIPALGHVYTEWEFDSEKHQRVCTGCGKTQKMEHNIASGEKECAECGYSKVVPTPNKDTEYTVENLGNFTKTIYLRVNDGGYRNDGTPVIYTVSDGNPMALFIMLHAETGEILLERELEKSSGAWGVFTHSSGDVYITGHGSPYFYKFDHKTEKIILIGELPKDSSMGQAICETSDGKIFSGSTESLYFWGYDPGTGKFIDMPYLIYGATKYSAVAYDKKENDLYVSVLTKDAKNYLFRVDLETNKKEDITPAEYRNNPKFQFYDMMIFGDILIIRYPSTSETIFFNIREDKLVAFNQQGKTGAKWPMKTYCRNPAADPEDDTRFYSVVDNKLTLFDTKTMTYKITDIPGPVQMIKMVMLKLDQTKYPGYSACGLQSHLGKMQFVNIEKKKYVSITTKVQGGKNEGNCLTLTDSGLLIIGGNFGGSTGFYDTKTGEKFYYSKIGQQEGIAAYGNKVFLGSYPTAQLSLINTDVSLTSHTALLNMGKAPSISGYNNQDRPYNLLPIYEKGLMAVATIPAQGFTTGAIALLDGETGATKYHAIFPIKNMSAASLAYSDGKLFMGTTVAAGSGTSSIATQALLVAMDVDSKEIKTYDLPFSARGILALCTDDNGKIWGMGYNNIFCFDPETEKFEYTQKLDLICNNGGWRDLKMSLGGDGTCVFLSNSHTKDFYRFDLETKAFDIIAEDIGCYHQGDEEGNFYFIDGVNVNKLAFKY